MPQKKQKKQKKTLTKKTKLKNSINVKINIDNSKKTTARRTPLKVANMQPFANFPSYQPTRIQQLEPKYEFSKADLTKYVDEMYQKQSQTQNEFERNLIAKFDDSKKKNTAPPKPPEESKPGASTEYTDYEGETVYSEPVIKTNKFTKDDSNLKVGFSSISKTPKFQINKINEINANQFEANNLIAQVIDEEKLIDERIQNATSEELTQTQGVIKEKQKELKTDETYQSYVNLYKIFYGDNNYKNFDDKNKENKPITSAQWASMVSIIKKQILKYGTNENKLNQKEEEKKVKKTPEKSI